MRVLGFNGSPRKDGNTAWAINMILDGAKEQGAHTECWHSGELDISPCRGCLGCVQNDKCVINDDMQRIYSALIQTDVIVLGSPVYMAQMSAQAKTFTDRLFALIAPRFSPRFKEENAGKKLILLFTQGNPNAEMFQAYFDYTKNMFQMLEFDVIGLHVIAGLRNEKAHERMELHGRMKEIGRIQGM